MRPAPPILGDLLRDVSRSFYLTLRWLPGSVRSQIGLAYLLARATDTVADTEILPVAERLKALQELRARILGTRTTPLDLGKLAGRQGTPAERTLLERCEEALGELDRLSPFDQAAIREVIGTITSGQELDLQRFAGASGQNIAALGSDEELDDYTYRVAGCVGEFWTTLCRAHVFPRAKLDDAALRRNGIRFGQGLQLVNVLRDIPADLRQGRCYLPLPALRQAGLTPSDLLDPSVMPRLQPVYDYWLARAQEHLTAGWTYTNSLPWRHARVRLPCAWPILLGRQTLDKLRQGNVLDPAQRIKVSRGEVKGMILRTLAVYGWPPAWRKLFP